jgi:putative copper export protein
MSTVYNVSLFVHVSAVIIWIGGLVAIGILNARLAREQERSAMAPFARASRFFGGAVVGPASALTLIAGIVMVVDAGLGFDTLWIAWGLAGIFLSLLLGATLIRRAGNELSAATEVASQDHARIPSLQRRLRNLSILNLILLFSVVFGMVFKPTL